MLQKTISAVVLTLLFASTAFAVPMLNLGQVTVTGDVLAFPVTLANIQSASISGIETDIVFDPDAFAPLVDSQGVLDSATAGPAAIAAGKQISQSNPTDKVLHIAITDIGKSLISEGKVAEIRFTIKPGIYPSNRTFTTNRLSATGPDGQPVSIAGSNTYVTSIADALLVLRAAVGIVTLTAEQRLWADINKDAVVDVGDALMLLARAVGL